MGSTTKRGYWFPAGNDAVSLFPGQNELLFMKKLDTDMHTALTAAIASGRIPNLPASKITSGTFAEARIPTIKKEKLDSLVWAQVSEMIQYATDDAATDPVSLSRLPNLPASKTTSGTFDDARIPSTIARSAAVDSETAALDESINAVDAKLTAIIKELEDVSRETGPRKMTAEMGTQPTNGDVYISRIGKIVFIQIYYLTFADNDSFVRLGANMIPKGFRPRRTTDFAAARRISTDTGGSIRIDTSGDMYIYQVIADREIVGIGSYETTDEFPTTLPGTPA